MKWVLGLSLLLNAVLGYLLTQKEVVVREEVVEKVVVKKAPPRVVEKEVIVKVPGESAPTNPAPVDYDEVAVDDALSDVDKRREDFLVGKLGVSEKEMKAVEEIKLRYSDRYQKIAQNDPGPLSIAQRKELLRIEEERDQEYERLFGKARWSEWVKYRDGYNRTLFKRSLKEQSGVIVPMEI